jgi:flagella basal body P-ring formation protein FlgA
MKRTAAFLIALTTLTVLSPRAECATVYEIVVRQLIDRFHLDTATCKIEVLSSQVADDSVSSERVRIQPLFQKEPVGLVSLVAEITGEDKSVRRGQISLRVHRFAPVYVAAGTLKTHEIITEDKLVQKTMEVTSLREQPVTSLDGILGYRSKRNLSGGQILTSEAVEPVPDIEVGREVSILFKGESFTITTHGQAMQTGWHGQLIRVRNGSSGKVILARVSGTNEVDVEL